VDIEGKLLGFDPAAATADAERVKHRLEQHLLGADHAEQETYGSMTKFSTYPATLTSAMTRSLGKLSGRLDRRKAERLPE
jgi:hypothetical protein